MSSLPLDYGGNMPVDGYHGTAITAELPKDIRRRAGAGVMYQYIEPDADNPNSEARYDILHVEDCARLLKLCELGLELETALTHIENILGGSDRAHIERKFEQLMHVGTHLFGARNHWAHSATSRVYQHLTVYRWGRNLAPLIKYIIGRAAFDVCVKLDGHLVTREQHYYTKKRWYLRAPRNLARWDKWHLFFRTRREIAPD